MSVGGDADIDAYDRIARWYDVDMARNMSHDDVGFYRSLARDCGGPEADRWGWHLACLA